MDFFKGVLNQKPIIAEPSYKNFSTIQKKSFEEVLDEETELDIIFQFDVAKCYICKSPIANLFHWYHFENYGTPTNPIVVCSPDCLREIENHHEIDKDNTEIVEYSRCTAYFKCRELDNLRNKCERKESLITKDYSKLLVGSTSMFCDPAQAGIIMSTYKMNEVLEKFSHESDRQFKINFSMTILVIVLTIVNLVVAIRGTMNKTTERQLNNLNHSIIQSNKEINTSVKKIFTAIKNQEKSNSKLKVHNKD
jgi:hypothetical protein